jgi:acyl carrier protein
MTDPLRELKKQIKELIVRELDVRDRMASEIDEAAPLFGEGLGLDSLDALQLAMAVEEQFSVRIPEGEEAKGIFASVSSLAEYIANGGGKTT